MNPKPRITLDIPDPEGFDDEFSHPIPVSSEVVAYTIDLLQCFIAQHRLDEACEPDDTVWDRLAAAAGHALAGLLSALNASYHHRDGRALVEQIAFFCCSNEAPELKHLCEPEAVFIPGRGPRAADIVAALLALWEHNQRRLGEHGQAHQQQPAAQQEPATPQPAADPQRDWEF